LAAAQISKWRHGHKDLHCSPLVTHRVLQILANEDLYAAALLRAFLFGRQSTPHTGFQTSKQLTLATDVKINEAAVRSDRKLFAYSFSFGYRKGAISCNVPAPMSSMKEEQLTGMNGGRSAIEETKRN